ncbi:MAG: DUF805 domain-containing protein [Muribaculaceae bacterium]|nr:DUF805 domain-containing protein [Muribaculaceae bacterium]
MYQKELTFMEAVKKVYLKNYCNFSGRASRSEFWWSYLAQYAMMMILYCVMIFLTIITTTILMAMDAEETTASIVTMLICAGPMIILGLILLLPSLGVTVRRLHDTGRSGWYILISLIPLAGLILYYWLALPSDMYENQYGPVPNVEQLPWENNSNSTFSDNTRWQ